MRQGLCQGQNQGVGRGYRQLRVQWAAGSLPQAQSCGRWRDPAPREPGPRAALRPGRVGVSGRRPAPSRRARRGGRGSVPARQASRRLSFWTVVSEAGARHSRQCCSSGTSDSVQPTQRRGRNEAADPAGRIAESRPRRPRTTALPGAPGLGRGGAGTDAHERDLAALLKTVLVLGRVMVWEAHEYAACQILSAVKEKQQVQQNNKTGPDAGEAWCQRSRKQRPRGCVRNGRSRAPPTWVVASTTGRVASEGEKKTLFKKDAFGLGKQWGKGRNLLCRTAGHRHRLEIRQGGGSRGSRGEGAG